MPTRFYMPAEWSSHKACWMAWPCRIDLWPDIEKARNAFATVVQAISEFEPVIVVCDPKDKAGCTAKVGAFATVLDWAINDSWTRDSGPIFVKDDTGIPTLLDYRFNGWGEKFVPFNEDAMFVHRAAKHLSYSLVTSNLVAEGGAIHVDGEGTALTTRQCLLNKNRNPDWTEQQIDQELSRVIGADKVIWLNEGLLDDHTDGHIDELACFSAPGKVLALYTDDQSDANFKTLNENFNLLSNSIDAKGRKLEVTKIMQPEARYLADGTRMSLSYINFYIANGGIVMAEFNQPDYDRAAKEVIQAAFPDRKITQIPALEVFEGGGGIHCITQQQPNFDGV